MKNIIYFLINISVLSAPLVAGAPKGNEILERRDIDSKTFALGESTYQVVLSSQPMHYPDENGVWREIHLEWDKTADGFMNYRNLMEVRLKNSGIRLKDRLSDAEILIDNFNMNSQEIEFEDFSVVDSKLIHALGSNITKLQLELLPACLRLKFRIDVSSLTQNAELSFDMVSNNLELHKFQVSKSNTKIFDKFKLNILYVNQNNPEISPLNVKILNQKPGRITISSEINSSRFEKGELIELIIDVTRIVNLAGNHQSMYKSGDNYEWIDPGVFMGVYQSAGLVKRYQETWNINDRKIPDNATILSATHEIDLNSGQNQNVDVKVVSIDYNSVGGGSPQSFYNTIGSGLQYDIFNPLFIGDTYSKSYSQGQGLCNDLQNSLSNNGIYIGAKLVDETEYGEVNFSGTISSGARLIVTYSAPANVTVKNDFEYGEIEVDYELRNSPYNTLKLWDQTYGGDTIQMRAINMQDYGGARRLWDEWELPGGFTNPAIEITYQMPDYDPKEFIANFTKEYDFIADNRFVEGGEGGQMIINGQSQPAPYTTVISENGSIEVEALYQYNINGINRSFTDWNDGISDRHRFYTPQQHTSLQANYKANLRTSQPENGNAINQRRVISANGYWYMVY